jgi:hypothetical protein
MHTGRILLHMLAGLAAGLLAIACFHLDSQSKEPVRIPEALAYDVIDGRVVASTRLLEAPRGEGGKPLLEGPYMFPLAPFGGTATRQSDGLTWELVAGQARIFEDPLSGDTIFEPQGTVPVVVRPGLGGISGPSIEIGIDPSRLPVDQRSFLASGGGLCAANPNHPQMLAVTGGPFEVDVRSVVNASVRPLSLSERVLTYQHAQYHAWSPKAGSMRVRHNPSFVSTTRLRSASSTATGEFFPASAETNLFFIIDFLDHGISVFNKKPLHLTSGRTSWPPFRSPQVNRSGDSTQFYLLNAPDVLMMEITSQEMYVYPSTEVDVQLDDMEISDQGDLHAAFSLINQTERSSRVRWFLLGNFVKGNTPTEALLNLPPGQRQRVKIAVVLRPHLLTQFVTLGVVSETEPRLTGSRRVEFLFPKMAEVRKRLLRENG